MNSDIRKKFKSVIFTSFLVDFESSELRIIHLINKKTGRDFTIHCEVQDSVKKQYEQLKSSL